MIQRKIHQLEAQAIAFGRLATQAATLLMGKHKTCFVKNQDCGDAVKIANIKQVKFTGKKLLQKKYMSHSNYPGGLKERGLDDLFKKNPEKVFRDCVYDMLPKNKLRESMIKRLTFVK